MTYRVRLVRALDRSTAPRHHGLAVRIRDFLLLVYDELSRLLPKRYAGHQWRVRWSLLQVYFETAAIHYEVWVQKKNQRVELGLHFEGEPEENYAWAAALAPRANEIMAELGPECELEEWTRAWTRLHETVAFQGQLNETLAREIAARIAQYIEVLEPIRDEVGRPDVATKAPAAARAGAAAGAPKRARGRARAARRRA